MHQDLFWEGKCFGRCAAADIIYIRACLSAESKWHQKQSDGLWEHFPGGRLWVLVVLAQLWVGLILDREVWVREMIGQCGREASWGNTAWRALEGGLPPPVCTESWHDGSWKENPYKQTTREHLKFWVEAHLPLKCRNMAQCLWLCCVLTWPSSCLSLAMIKIYPSKSQLPVYMEAFPVRWHTPQGVSCFVDVSSSGKTPLNLSHQSWMV